ncbi:hypothetical protein LPJ73_004613 [Coemansia sp. RSA 2703]|nr:hypothetical protein LPJ73_004613 [Coemansia sp. RSA 2703]
MLFAFAVVGCVLIVYTRATVPTVRRQFYRDKAPIDSSTPKSIPTPTTTPDLAPMSILSPMPTQAVYALALVIQRTAEFSIQLECNGSNDVTVANQVGPSGEASMDTERDVPFANDPIQTSTTTALTVACTSEFFTQPQCSDGDDASMVSSVVLEVEASINTEGYVMATDSLTATPIPSPVPTLVASPVSTPVASPVSTPVASPVSTRVSSPVPTSVVSPVPTPVFSPVSIPVASPMPTPVASPVPTPVSSLVPTPVASPVPIPARPLVWIPTPISPALALAATSTSEFFAQFECGDGRDAAESSALTADDPFLANLASALVGSSDISLQTVCDYDYAESVASSTDCFFKDLATDDWIFIPSGSGCYEERNGTKTAQRLKKLKKRSSKSSLFSLHK